MKKLKNILDLHRDKFKKEAVIIGLFWNNPSQLYDNISKAIKTGKPYNENKLIPNKYRDKKLLF